jgi:hypothetical protein
MPTHLTADELATRWRMSPGSLQNWRTQGKGPKWIKFGKRVLYPLAVVEKYEADRLKGNTGQ